MRGIVLTCLVSCARPAPVGLPEITTADWSRARTELADARAALPAKPYVEREGRAPYAEPAPDRFNGVYQTFCGT